MKRLKLLKHIRNHKCFLLREGRKHSVYYNPESKRLSTIPRHREIDDVLTNKICKDLGVPQIKDR